MKKIPKKLLDECIDASRDFWNSDTKPPYTELLDKEMKFVQKLSKKVEIDWMAIKDFLDSILMPKGFAPDAENDEIYCALRVLGWDVID